MESWEKPMTKEYKELLYQMDKAKWEWEEKAKIPGTPEHEEWVRAQEILSRPWPFFEE